MGYTYNDIEKNTRAVQHAQRVLDQRLERIESLLARIEVLMSNRP